LVAALAGLWVTVVAGGWLALLAPDLTFTTPVGHLVPQGLLGNALVHDMLVPTMAEIQRSGQRYPTGGPTGEPAGNYPDNPPTGRVSYPSTRYENYSIFNGGVQVSVPNNWRQVNDGNSVWFVPEGAYGQYNGQAVYTHGASFGVAQTNSRNLQSATQDLINGLAQGNNNLRASGGYQRTTMSGRNALFTTLSNVNEATGRPETVRVITTQLRNGQLFYMIAVAPQNERNFENAFQTILQSIRIND